MSKRETKYLVPKFFDITIDTSQENLYHIFNIGHEVAEGYDSHNKSKVELHVVVPQYIFPVQQYAIETSQENWE